MGRANSAGHLIAVQPDKTKVEAVEINKINNLPFMTLILGQQSS